MTNIPTHHPITGEKLYTREELLKLTKEHIETQWDFLIANLRKKRTAKNNHVTYA